MWGDVENLQDFGVLVSNDEIPVWPWDKSGNLNPWVVEKTTDGSEAAADDDEVPDFEGIDDADKTDDADVE